LISKIIIGVWSPTDLT